MEALGLMAERGGKLEVGGDPWARALVSAWLSGRSPRTLEAYRGDLRDFRAFTGLPTVEHALSALLKLPQGEANRAAMTYRAHLLDRGLAPATVNRRLAALRSVCTLARRLGYVSWTLEVDNVRSESYRDTRGPGVEGFRRLLVELEERGGDAKAKRDRAALRLLFDLGLRRAEVVALDVEDVDLERGTVAVIGKGKREKALRSLPPATAEALSAWLQELGQDTGPVFVNLSPSAPRARLRLPSLTRLVKTLGKQAGVKVTPHGLRHAAITRLLELTGGDVTAVREFSRHADVRTLMIYDDRRTNRAGELAELLAQDSVAA